MCSLATVAFGRRMKLENLLEVLELNAIENSHRRAFTFLSDGGEESVLTYEQLRSSAVRIAIELSEFTAPGERALLVYPTGLDFVAAFFGCIYAGVLPVPATYPRPRRPMPRLSAISDDCDPAVVLTTTASLQLLDVPSVAPQLAERHWIATDQLAQSERSWVQPRLWPDDLAFLQYTSGSTNQPKGVMVSHRNVLHNIAMIRLGNDAAESNRTGAFWLPAYHDMGLICGILGVVAEGGHSVLMSPTSFLQRPIRWLQAISEYRAAVSGAPNFAYDYCVRKTTPQDREGLDLSSWKVAFCSGEPVRSETLDNFAKAFAPAGFTGGAFYPCYGLAEATLLAAGNIGPAHPSVKHVSREALAGDRVLATQKRQNAQPLVDCGQALLNQKIAIVEPESLRKLDDDQVGEIWIKGESVAQGYWERPTDTAQIFHAETSDGEGPFLRTGDLGFLSNGRLFVTGRIKDVIIIRGQNHYPQDIEKTAEASHDALMFGAGAAFAVDSAFGERLVVVNEIDRHHRHEDLDEVIAGIRKAVAETHDLEVGAVVLIRQASLPRTTSGKQQRGLCRTMFESGDLKVTKQWLLDTVKFDGESSVAPDSVNESGRNLATATTIRRPPRLPQQAMATAGTMDEGEVQRFADQIESWLIDWLVQRGGIDACDAMRNRPFADYGIDSMAAVELTQELEDWLGVQVSAVIAWRYPTPATLSQFLAQEACGGERTVEATAVPRRRTVDDFSRILAEVQATSDEDARRQLDKIGNL